MVAREWIEAITREALIPSYLHDGVSSRQSLDGPAAALRLVVGPVVGLGLQLDLQAVGPRA